MVQTYLFYTYLVVANEERGLALCLEGGKIPGRHHSASNLAYDFNLIPTGQSNHDKLSKGCGKSNITTGRLLTYVLCTWDE